MLLSSRYTDGIIPAHLGTFCELSRGQVAENLYPSISWEPPWFPFHQYFRRDRFQFCLNFESFQILFSGRLWISFLLIHNRFVVQFHRSLARWVSSYFDWQTHLEFWIRFVSLGVLHDRIIRDSFEHDVCSQYVLFCREINQSTILWIISTNYLKYFMKILKNHDLHESLYLLRASHRDWKLVQFRSCLLQTQQGFSSTSTTWINISWIHIEIWMTLVEVLFRCRKEFLPLDILHWGKSAGWIYFSPRHSRQNFHL